MIFIHSNDDRLRFVLEMSICLDSAKYCAELAHERKLSTITCFFLFRSSPRVDRAVTDDRNNWIAGCLKHAHFKRTAEWILKVRVSGGNWKIRFGSTLRNSALEYKCVFCKKRYLMTLLIIFQESKRDNFTCGVAIIFRQRMKKICKCFCEKVSYKKLYSWFFQIYYYYIHDILKELYLLKISRFF